MSLLPEAPHALAPSRHHQGYNALAVAPAFCTHVDHLADLDEDGGVRMTLPWLGWQWPLAFVECSPTHPPNHYN